jgi:hypothetical protein
MGVNNIISIRLFLFACSVVLCSACNAGDKEVLDHASRKILKSTAAYGDCIEHCDKLVKSSKTPRFDSKKMASLNISREEALTAIAFLKFYNYFQCEREARMELAFHLGTMMSLKRELQVDTSSTEAVQSLVSYPSSRELEMEIRYLELSQSQRDYLESIVGNEPFDLMKALEVNKLMRE